MYSIHSYCAIVCSECTDLETQEWLELAMLTMYVFYRADSEGH